MRRAASFRASRRVAGGSARTRAATASASVDATSAACASSARERWSIPTTPIASATASPIAVTMAGARGRSGHARLILMAPSRTVPVVVSAREACARHREVVARPLSARQRRPRRRRTTLIAGRRAVHRGRPYPVPSFARADLMPNGHEDAPLVTQRGDRTYARRLVRHSRTSSEIALPRSSAGSARSPQEYDSARSVTLVIYGWKKVQPGTLAWVFPSRRRRRPAPRTR